MNAIRILTCGSLIVGLAPFLAAQQEPKEPPATTTVQTKTIKLMRVTGDLVGKTLVNAKDEPLGQIEDVVVHPRGDIAFVEASGAGALETGKRIYPIPWRALTRNETGQFVLDTTPDTFKKMPYYGKDKRRDLADMGWWIDADAAYKNIVGDKASPVEASTSLAPAKKLFLASELRSRSIESPEGDKVATVHEIVIDPRVGRTAYVVLGVGGNLGAGEKMVAVPWDALKSMPDKSNPKLERLTLATTNDKLMAAPEFQTTTEGWAKASEPDYVLHVYEYYSLPVYTGGEKPKK